MKKLLIIVFVFGSAMAFSQEIRVPDEKRESYSKEKKESPSISSDQMKEQARQSGVRTATTLKPEGAPVFSIIQEFSYPGKQGKERVIILNALDQMGDVKMDPKKAELIKATLNNKRNYASGLDALQHFLSLGWTLENVSVYPNNEEVVREYMMKM